MRRITALFASAAVAGLLGGCSSAAAAPDAAEVELADYALVAVRLPDAEDRSVEELLQLPPEELAAFFPGVATVLLQAPGSDETIVAEGDGTLPDAGRYLVLCAIPVGADPGEYLAAAAEAEGGPPQGVEGGPPHFVNGMWAELTVVE